MLGRYGIGADDWELLRTAPQPSQLGGQRYLTPGDIGQVPDAPIEALLRANGTIGAKASAATIATAVKNYRWQIGDRILTMIDDTASRGTVTPGIREQAMVLGTSRPGSWEYIARRVLGQFKYWPLASYNQVLMHGISDALSGSQVAWNVGAIVALSVLGGALRLSINDFAAGKPQRNYMNPVVLGEALAAGGGFGLYTDLLFGQTTSATNAVVSAAGPLVGDAEKLMEIWGTALQDAKNGNYSKAITSAWPNLIKFGVAHVPFANLIYLKASLDYLFWFRAYEAVSPGWWERTNRQMIKDQGRGYVGYSPGGGVPFGVPGIYLKNNAGQSFGLLGQNQ
jgi:hypothetical protein